MFISISLFSEMMIFNMTFPTNRNCRIMFSQFFFPIPSHTNKTDMMRFNRLLIITKATYFLLPYIIQIFFGVNYVQTIRLIKVASWFDFTCSTFKYFKYFVLSSKIKPSSHKASISCLQPPTKLS